MPLLRGKLSEAKDITDFINFLKGNDFKFSANQAVRAAEQLPMDVVSKFAEMKDGQSMFNPSATGAQVVVVAASRSQPVDEARSAPAIEQFLLNERKRKLVDDDLKALRGAAKVEYIGEYAKGGAREVTPPAPAASEAPPLTSVAPPPPVGSIPKAAPQIEVEPINTGPASSPATGTLEKGMKGFK